MPNYAITHLPDVAPVDCPCGQARRAFLDQSERVASLHLVEITETARTHYHKHLTEIYYVLEGSGQMELDGQLHPIRPGDSILIKPGCRHRAICQPGEPLQILNLPVPAFDPDDEWFDD